MFLHHVPFTDTEPTTLWNRKGVGAIVMHRTRVYVTAILVLSLTSVHCGPGSSGPPPIGAPSPVIYGLDSANTLVVFRATRPDLVTRTTAVTGLPVGERLVGIDFRPADGRLYGLGRNSRLYFIDTTSGAATAIGTAAFTPVLAGTTFGVDFDPVVDRVRVMSDSAQNLRLDPLGDTLAAVDSTLVYATGDAHAGAAPGIAAAAYTNSVTGASSTVLYAIDAAVGVLVTIPAPNSGQMSTVGALAVSTIVAVGFDIDGSTGLAYVTLTPAVGASRFYGLNLGTANVTLTGTVGHVVPLVGIAIHP